MSNIEPAITVREATEADLPEYVKLSADFHAASPMQRVCEFEPEGFKEFVVAAILLVVTSIFWIRLTLRFLIQNRADIAKAFWWFLGGFR